MTNIDLITDPEMDLLGRATQLGEEIGARLRAAMDEVNCIGEVRGRGLMVGCEVVADREPKNRSRPRRWGRSPSSSSTAASS